MGFYTKTHEELISAGYKKLARWRVAYAEVLTFWGKDKYSGVSMVTFSGQTNKHLITQNDLDMLGEFFTGYTNPGLQGFDYDIQYEFQESFKKNNLQVPQGSAYDYVTYRLDRILKMAREKCCKVEIDNIALLSCLEADL